MGLRPAGNLRCGVSEVSGLLRQDADGRWRGFDVDFCAGGGGGPGDPDKVELVPLLASTVSRAADAPDRPVADNTTWTLTREAVLRMQFPASSSTTVRVFWSRPKSHPRRPRWRDHLRGKGNDAPAHLDAYFETKGWSGETAAASTRLPRRESLLRRSLSRLHLDASLLAAMRCGPGSTAL